MDYNFKKISEDKNKTEIEVKVELKELDKYKDQALEVLGKDVKIEGFRPGKAPKHLIEAKLGSKVISEAVTRLIVEVAYEIIQKEEFKPVRQPEYDLKKIDEKEGILFNFTFTNYPNIKLGDFSKIKVKKEEVEISDEEIETVIKSIIRSSIKPERIKELTNIKEEKKESVGKEEKKQENSEEKKEVDFELNDKLVEELGYEKEKTLKDIKEAVKERLSEMKSKQIDEKYSNEIVSEAIKLSTFDIPDVFIEPEVEHSEKHFKERLDELKLDINTYIATQGKTMEDLREDWKKQAIDRVSIDLVLINIAMQNDLMPTEEEVQHEIDLITDPTAKHQYDNENGREYIRTVLARRKGLDKLLETVESKETKSKK